MRYLATIGFTVFHPIAARYFPVSSLSAFGGCVSLGIVIAEGWPSYCDVSTESEKQPSDRQR
jgi:hypothetical protein